MAKEKKGNKLKRICKWLKKNLLKDLVVWGVTAAIVYGINYQSSSRFKDLVIEELSADITGIKSTINDLRASNMANESRISNLERDCNSYRKISFFENVIPIKLGKFGATIENNNVCVVGADDSDIAVDLVTNDLYTIKDLVETRILTTYYENGYQVVFWGQYDEQGRWDGLCVINVYKDNTLSFVTEAVYNSGVIESYYQVFKGEQASTWYESIRTLNGDYYDGITRKYRSQECIAKQFNDDEVDSSEVIGSYEMLCKIDARLLGYYNGRTTDGIYNDDTGRAYLITYFSDGTVKTLYVGRFRNGQFCDKSDDSWYIAKDEDTDYMYYKGAFKDGKPQHNKKSTFENKLTIDRIREIVSEYDFEQKLDWNVE